MNPPGPESEGTPIRILLLEDNRLDADLTRLRLESLRMPVSLQVVETEADFCRALDVGDIDIVLADFMLPAFSGAEALAIVRERSPDLPFVVVSGVLGEEHAVEILKKGATDYVDKQRLQRFVQRAAVGFLSLIQEARGASLHLLDRETENIFGGAVQAPDPPFGVQADDGVVA